MTTSKKDLNLSIICMTEEVDVLVMDNNSYCTVLHLFFDGTVSPTNEAFGLGSKLFALLRPSLFLASQAADEAGRRLHLVSATLGVLQQRLVGQRKGRLKGQQGQCRQLCQQEVPLSFCTDFIFAMWQPRRSIHQTNHKPLSTFYFIFLANALIKRKRVEKKLSLTNSNNWYCINKTARRKAQHSSSCRSGDFFVES